MAKTAHTLPEIRSISPMRPLVWLVLAWRDMAQVGWLSFAHGLVLALSGAAIVAIAHQKFWLLAGALSGFLVVAPVLATSLYALSRALENGETAAQGGPVHTGDNRYRQRVDGLEHRGRVARIAQVVFARVARHLRHPREIGARAE